MSAPLAGKFQDHYAILGINASADQKTIRQAYDRLVGKYGRDNIDTRDDEKLGVVAVAYETLSNAELRKAFDAVKGISRDDGRPKFSGFDFFEILGREAALRTAVLCVLYDRRRNKPSAPSLSPRQVESILESPVEALNFAVWYLKQRGLAGSDDKSNLSITVEGMDFLEAQRPDPTQVMPFIKPSAIASPPPSAEPAVPADDSLQSLMEGVSSAG